MLSIPELKQRRPADAKKVFDGILYTVYQWPQKRFDGSIATFEQLKRNDTVQVIAITQKQILVISQEQPGRGSYTGLPGGMINQGEDVFAAANRELLEETGYSSSEYDLFDVVQPNSEIDWRVFTCIAKNATKKSVQDVDPGECIQIQTVSFDEFVTIATSENFNDIEVTLKLIPGLKDPNKLMEIKKAIWVMIYKFCILCNDVYIIVSIWKMQLF